MDTFVPNKDAGSSSSSSYCFHSLFEVQAQQTPDRVAAALGDEQLTYYELDRRANQLARYLRQHGIGPDMPVGLYFERSLEMLISLLAIFKAGGAYLPLDPAYPRERISFMLEDSQVTLILTSTPLQATLPETVQSSCLCIDRDWSMIAQMSPEPLSAITSASHLAYILYTSGSTGVPKGVLVEHRSVINLFFGLAQAIYTHLPAAPLRISLNGSLSFDTSVKQLVQLLAGHTLYLVPELIRLDGESLRQYLDQYNIQIFDCTPSQLRLLLDQYASRESTLMPAALLVGGEAIDENLWNRLAALKDCQVYNLYGPAECTVDAAVWRIQPRSTVPTIGCPIRNVALYILGAQQKPVSEGEIGEIHIAGAGLTRGYLRQPELTAQVFLPDPFSAEPGARLYKTGDLGRLLPDGTIEFVGRADHQVKVRGFRIELEEIEKVLVKHEAVQDCAVVAHTYGNGEVRLIGYIVPVRFPDLVLSELRQFLQARLPEYMLPAPIIVLEQLPLSPNGKLDRQALPAPDLTRPELDTPFIPPVTPMEEMLAGIWTDVLGIQHIGRNDNFFELGGHSLLVTQTISRIRQAFQVEIPLNYLFEAPTIADLAQMITRASTDEQETTLYAIQPVSRDQLLPLTFAQERVWFMHQLYPESRAYYFRTILRLHGRVDVGLLEQTFSEIVRRHEIFRTTFHEVDGRPVQRIHDPWPVSVPYVDLRSFSAEALEEQEQQWIRREFARMFDLEQLPLARWVLLHTQEHEYTLIQTEHHLVHDGWSFNVLLREFKELYQAFSQGQTSPLPELSVQFADFAYWQREWLHSEEASRQLAYWQQKLAGSQPMLPLPMDRPRPAVQSFQGRLRRVELSPDLARELRALSRREGVTLFMLMLAAFKTLLYRYTHQEDILVGSGIANRRWRETEELIGMVINTVALRTDFSGALTFKEVLQRVRKTTLEAYANQDLPFEEVVRALQPGRHLSSNPLVQVMFGFHDAPLPDLRLPDFSVEVLDLLDNGSAKFDLAVIVIPRAEQSIGTHTGPKNEGITLIWEYNTDLFNADTIERLLGHFHTLLTGIVACPDQHPGRLPLLTAPEQQQLLVEWNRTQSSYPNDKCIHQLFEAAVRRYPDAIALVSGEQQVTYAELNRRANQVAHYLLEQHVGVEDMVGVCVERHDFLLCILAILKVGACYVPLEPAFPQERLAYLLEDTGIHLILAHRELAACLPEKRAQTIYVNEMYATFSEYAQDNPQVPVFAQNAAYVMYTSGSTGQPKGIVCPHQAVVRLVMNTPYLPFSAEQTFLQLAPVSFDASTLEIWGALLHGARLVLFPNAVPSLDELGEMLQQQQVTVLWLTTGLFHQMVDMQLAALTPVRYLITGGDVVSPLHVKKVMDALPLTQVSNGYGPTEGTTFTSCYPVQSAEAIQHGVPIGRPIANTQVYVLDQWKQPVPIGVVGELYVGGDGLARGYMKRPELTAASFLPDPWSSAPGARLYKSGDLVRYRADGVIEFIGRADTQVKLRGFRIELSEIETVLLQAPGVQQCAVIVHANAQGDKHLVAYVVVDQPEQMQPQRLRAYLEERLPPYMVPAFFIPIDAIPLTATAKIDRRALDKAFRSADTREIAQPVSPIEVALAHIWKQVLSREDIGVQDDFFALGGHSLSLMRLQARLRDHFQVKLPLQTLFVNTTIAQQARYIEDLLTSVQQRSIPQSQASTSSSPLVRKTEKSFFAPMSSAQQRQWFLDQLDPGNPAYNVFRGLHLRGPLDRGALQRALQAIVDRHEILRTSLVKVDGQLLQEILYTYSVELPQYPLCGSSEEALEADLRQQVLEAARYTFHLSEGPLWHATLLERDASEHFLLLTFHHAMIDGWSLTIFMRELQQFYAHFARNEQLDLQELTMQYGQYAQRQQQWLAEEQAEQHIVYWTRQLAGIQTLNLPFDHPRLALPDFRGARLPFHLAASDLQALKVLSQQQGVTLFMTLLTAFKLLLACYTGQQDIVVGTDVANRTTTEVEPLIGLFVNQLVLRTSFADDLSFLTALREVRAMMLGAYAHQDVPFEKLVELLRPEREVNRNPLFQVKFVLQQPQIMDFELADIHATVFNYDNHTAKFDLLLNVQESEQGLVGIVQYSVQLFERETIEQLIMRFSLLLQRVIAQPNLTLRKLRDYFAEDEQAYKARQVERKAEKSSELLHRTQRKAISADKQI